MTHIEEKSIDLDDDLTTQQKDFVVNLGVKGMKKGEAYAAAYGHDAQNSAGGASASASRLLKDAKIKKALSDMNTIYKGLSEWALSKQLELVMDSKTPPAVKNAILKEIQDRAGHNATQKIETTKKVKYPEFNMSPEELHEIIEEAKRPNTQKEPEQALSESAKSNNG